MRNWTRRADPLPDFDPYCKKATPEMKKSATAAFREWWKALNVPAEGHNRFDSFERGLVGRGFEAGYKLALLRKSDV